MSAVARVFALDVIAKAILAVLGVTLIRIMPGPEYAHYTFAVAVIALTSDALVTSWRTIFVAGGRTFDDANALGPFIAAQLLIIGVAVVVTVPFSAASSGLYWIMTVVIVGKGIAELGRGAHLKALNFLTFAGVEVVRVLVLCVSVLVVVATIAPELQAWEALALEGAGLFIVGGALLLPHRTVVRLTNLRNGWDLLRRVASSHHRFLWAYLVLLGAVGQLDTMMLRLLSDEQSLATFGSSVRYYGILSMALAAVNVVFLPLASRIESTDDANRMMRGHRRLLVAFAAFAVIAIAVAGWAIPIIDQGRYPAAVPTFRILAVASIVSFAFSPYVNLLIRLEDFRFMLSVLTAGLVLDAAADIVLIPTSGAPGAAIGTLLSSALITGSIFLRSRHLWPALSALTREKPAQPGQSSLVRNTAAPPDR